jgi:hypothetical protein
MICVIGVPWAGAGVSSVALALTGPITVNSEIPTRAEVWEGRGPQGVPHRVAVSGSRQCEWRSGVVARLGWQARAAATVLLNMA